MPTAPIIAAALTTPTAHPWILTLDSLDVIAQAGAHGQRAGTSIDALELDLEGPGGVSSLAFTIEDPARAVVVTEKMRVRLYDGTRGIERFRGWVDTWASRPWGTGRLIDVGCVGNEAILDWAKVPAFDWTTLGVLAQTAIMACVDAAIFPPGVSLVAKASTADAGNHNAGVGRIDLGWNIESEIHVENVTLREALTQIDRASTGAGSAPKGANSGSIQFTVDMYDALRAWPSDTKPADWTDLIIDDIMPGTLPVAADPSYQNDATGAVHAVYVVGGNAAGTGLVTDGTGIPGPIAVLNDDTILTSAAKSSAAFAYMNERRVTARMPLRLESYTPAGTFDAHVRTGSRVTVQDDQLGTPPGTAFLIDGLTVTWEAGGTRENWSISAGGKRPSAARLVRRLTRGILS